MVDRDQRHLFQGDAQEALGQRPPTPRAANRPGPAWWPPPRSQICSARMPTPAKRNGLVDHRQDPLDMSAFGGQFRARLRRSDDATRLAKRRMSPARAAARQSRQPPFHRTSFQGPSIVATTVLGTDVPPAECNGVSHPSGSLPCALNGPPRYERASSLVQIVEPPCRAVGRRSPHLSWTGLGGRLICRPWLGVGLRIGLLFRSGFLGAGSATGFVVFGLFVALAGVGFVVAGLVFVRGALLVATPFAV